MKTSTRTRPGPSFRPGARRMAARVCACGMGLALLTLGARAPASAAPARGRAARPTLIRDVQAAIDRLTPSGQEQADTTIEPSIAVNPANPNNAVTCYQVGRVDGGGDQVNGCAATFDGGKHWKQAYMPKLTLDTGGTWERASDAVVAFGPHNVVYANSLVFQDGSSGGDTNDSGVVNNISTDGGRHWSNPKVVWTDSVGGLNDKNWIVVDNSNASGHHLGRVYNCWDRVAPVWCFYSDDQGTTWSGPWIVDPGQGIGIIPVVLPNGDLAVVYDALASEDEGPSPEGAVARRLAPAERIVEPQPAVNGIAIRVAKLAGTVPTGGPLVFGPAITVSDYQSNGVRQQRAGGLPTADVDPKTGRIFVGWEDSRFRTDGVNDAVITWSDDEGVTWAPVKRVNPGPTGDYVDHYNTMLAVSPNGVLGVAYLQRQEAAALSGFSRYVLTYYQQSKDGGQTFTKPLNVNNKRSDVDFSAFSRGGAFFGDYDQVAFGGSRAYITRCVAFSTVPGEPATFPPTVHHQRTWVAVVSSGPS